MLHPQARALMDLFAERGFAPVYTLSPDEARRAYLERRFITQPPPQEVAQVQALRADGPAGPIPLRLYRPRGAAAAATLPVLIYIHGGGWVVGDLDSHDVLCRELANRSACTVVSVDYRRAPDHPFPAAVDDCLAATYWVHRHAAELQVDPARLAVGGDSAGGNLSAAIAVLARNAGDLPIVFQLLIYPATDMRCVAPSHTTNGQGYMLTRESIAYYRGHYTPNPASWLDPRASPLLTEDLSRLPPAFVLTAGYDPLRDEGLEYAERLSAAGTRSTQICFERQIHGFITMGRVLDEANAAVAICAAQLSAAVAG